MTETGNVLMIRTHKWSDRWGIPGGKIERGESATEALHREVLEETALVIDDVRFVIVQDCIDSPEFMRPGAFHPAQLHRPQPGPPPSRSIDEAEEFLWLPAAEALKLDLNQPTRVLLTEALERELIPHAIA